MKTSTIRTLLPLLPNIKLLRRGLRRNVLHRMLWIFMALSGGLAASRADGLFDANLDGFQAVPPHNVPGYGAADFSLSGTTLTLTVGTYQDLLGNSTAVTVNDAAAGMNGAVIFALELNAPGTTTGIFTGAGTLTAQQITDLQAGNLYVNIRTSVFPSGEIRGQITAVPTPLASQVPPPFINYQGRVLTNGVTFTGTGAFTFSLVDGGGNSYWTFGPTNIPVVRGLYSVRLGPLQSSLFASNALLLRVAFNDGVNGPQQFPDQPITSVGYALVAGIANTATTASTALTVAAGGVNAAALAPGSVTSAALAPGAITSAALPPDVAYTDTNQTFTGQNFFSNPDNSFTGIGAGLTGLNASQLTSGTVPLLALPTGIAFLGATQTFTGENSFSSPFNIFNGSFAGNGSLLTSLNASQLTFGTVPAEALPGGIAYLATNQTFTGENTFINSSNVFYGEFIGDGSGLTNLNAGQLTTGVMPDSRLSTNVPLLAATQTFTGPNEFTDPFNTFIGDGAGLTGVDAVKLGGLTAPDFWQIKGNAGTSPPGNFLGTTDDNPLELRVDGGRALRLEPTLESPNFIAGDSDNSATGGSEGAAIGGGEDNTVNGTDSTVGGGSSNIASHNQSTVGGGQANIASQDYATVGGGSTNSASGLYATVGGGDANTASGPGAFVGGGGFDGTSFGANQAAGNASVVAGGLGNLATASYAAVGGGWSNSASGRYSIVAGGQQNQAGGIFSGYATVGGGSQNTANQPFATVSGGNANTAGGLGAFVGGGGYDGTTFGGNNAGGNASSIVGGLANTNNGIYSAIGGGVFNYIGAAASSSLIAGGSSNGIPGLFGKTGVTIGGGNGNSASDSYATVPGGQNNSAAGKFSFAAGQRAKALYQGDFVLADSQPFDLVATTNDQFLIRATNGVGINSIPGPGVALSIGGTVNFLGGTNISGGTNVINFTLPIFFLPGAVVTFGDLTFFNALATFNAGALFAAGPVNFNVAPNFNAGANFLNIAPNFKAGANFNNDLNFGDVNLANKVINFNPINGGKINFNMGAGGLQIGGKDINSLFWTTSGNANTVPGTGANQNFIGTVDAQDLVLGVNSLQTMLYQRGRAGGTMSLIGGSGNTIDPNVTRINGSVIAGGTANLIENFDGANLSTADYSTISGGQNNAIESSGNGPGSKANYGVIGGGNGNKITAANYATIPGGQNNSVNAVNGFAAGQNATVDFAYSFVWGGGFNAAPVSDTGANQFVVGADGGAWFSMPTAGGAASALNVTGTSVDANGNGQNVSGMKVNGGTGQVVGGNAAPAGAALTVNAGNGAGTPTSASALNVVGSSPVVPGPGVGLNAPALNVAAGAAVGAATAGPAIRAAGNITVVASGDTKQPGTVTATSFNQTGAPVVAGSGFNGDGSGLYNLPLNAALFTGILPVSVIPVLPISVIPVLNPTVLPTNIAYLNVNQTFSASNTFSGMVMANNSSNQVTGTFTGNGGAVTNVNASKLGGLTAGSFWQLAGNNVSAGQFLGSTNNEPLDLFANNQRAFRLAPNANGPPNIVGGTTNNVVDTNVVGAVIAGGGNNMIQSNSDYSVIAGGYSNTVSGKYSFAGGQLVNVTNSNSFVWGDGSTNTTTTTNNQFMVRAINGAVFITGGAGLTVDGYPVLTGPGLVLQPNTNGPPNVIGGYTNNTVAAGATGAFIGGGSQNNISGNNSVIGGGYGNTNIANYATIAGGDGNLIATNSDQSVIGGGTSNTIESFSASSTIAGGVGNSIQTNSPASVVAGGSANSVSGTNSVIGGGSGNGNSANYATIAGGNLNFIATNADQSAIGGGVSNSVQSLATYSTIGGGYSNNIQAASYGSFIGGGEGNSILANAGWSVLAGGNGNSIQTNASLSVIAGGYRNSIQSNAFYSVIGGGAINVIQTNATEAVVGGGGGNSILANGQYGTIPGGDSNTATNYAFAAGYNAQAIKSGAFVWSDGTGTATISTAPNQFMARASGGVIFYSGTDTNSGVSLAAGSGTWSSLSDRNSKENLVSADPQEILAKVAALPVATWNYKSQAASIRHIGPMAQDFHAAFGVGEDERHITTVDEEGVALAAIKGLNQKLDEKNAQIQQLQETVAQLKEMVDKLALNQNQAEAK